jgi:hypothetical protein
MESKDSGGLTASQDPACGFAALVKCPCRDGGDGDLGQSAEGELLGLRSAR